MSAQTAFLLFLGVILLAVLLAVLVARTRPTARGADAAITAAVNAAITAALAEEYPLSNVQVDVKTFDGVVILGGYTHEQDQLKRAVEIARATPGVKSVDNRISVRSGH